MRASGTVVVLLLLVLLGTGTYEYRTHHQPNAKSSAAGSVQEAALTEASVTAFIGRMQGEVGNPNTLTKVRCTPASAWPSTFEHDPGHAYDCRATYTTSTQRWCILFNPDVNRMVTYFQGRHMCEGAPNPTIKP
jgi:hypothetical protein